jgi:uncharacterized membrane protein
MARPDGMILYAAQYDALDPAKEDFADIKELHKEKFVGFYDAALFTKKDDGKVKIIDTDESGRARGTVIGLVAGGVLGLIFPPTLLLTGMGAGAGALLGHLTTGMPRGDIKELGDMLDAGQAGIILIGETTMEEGFDRLAKRATKVAKKQVDASAADVKKAADEAAESS